MKNNFYILIATLFLLPACFFSKTETTQQNYLIQLIWESEGISRVRDKIKPIVDNIIEEELGLEKGTSKLFLKKRHQAITLYYLNGMNEKNEKIIFNLLENKKILPPANTPTDIIPLQELNFFGRLEDELVVMINDPSESLATLNHAIKKVLHAENTKYYKAHNEPLYDLASSEHFSFLPHTGLGRIRSNSIKHHLKDNPDADKIYQRIKNRIKTATLKVIQEILTPENQKIIFDKISIWALPKKIRIKEYKLNKND